MQKVETANTCVSNIKGKLQAPHPCILLQQLVSWSLPCGRAAVLHCACRPAFVYPFEHTPQSILVNYSYKILAYTLSMPRWDPHPGSFTTFANLRMLGNSNSDSLVASSDRRITVPCPYLGRSSQTELCYIVVSLQNRQKLLTIVPAQLMQDK